MALIIHGHPLGSTANIERRKEVLALARKYKFLILEGTYVWSVNRRASVFNITYRRPLLLIVLRRRTTPSILLHARKPRWRRDRHSPPFRQFIESHIIWTSYWLRVRPSPSRRSYRSSRMTSIMSSRIERVAHFKRSMADCISQSTGIVFVSIRRVCTPQTLGNIGLGGTCEVCR